MDKDAGSFFDDARADLEQPQSEVKIEPSRSSDLKGGRARSESTVAIIGMRTLPANTRKLLN